MGPRCCRYPGCANLGIFCRGPAGNGAAIPFSKMASSECTSSTAELPGAVSPTYIMARPGTGLRCADISYGSVLLIRATNLDIPPDIIFSGTAAIYLFQTGIPVPPLAAVLTRGELAIWLWESYNVDTLSILTASFALFIINLGVPALLGAAVIVKTKVLK